MTIFIETLLRCDGDDDCPMDGPYGEADVRSHSSAQQRDSAKKSGWIRIKQKDYCPDCAKNVSQPNMDTYFTDEKIHTLITYYNWEMIKSVDGLYMLRQKDNHYMITVNFFASDEIVKKHYNRGTILKDGDQ